MLAVMVSSMRSLPSLVLGVVWSGGIHRTIGFRNVLNGKHLVGLVLKGERLPLVVPLLLL